MCGGWWGGREIPAPAGSFDRVVSCEMIEAVGQEHLVTFHAAVDAALKPGGCAVIQVGIPPPPCANRSPSSVPKAALQWSVNLMHTGDGVPREGRGRGGIAPGGGGEQVGRTVAQGGAAAAQVIAEPDERYAAYCASSDFIREHIFPGGHLPCMAAMTAAARGTSLQVPPPPPGPSCHLLSKVRARTESLAGRAQYHCDKQIWSFSDA